MRLVRQVKDLGDAESVLEIKDLVRLDKIFAVNFQLLASFVELLYLDGVVRRYEYGDWLLLGIRNVHAGRVFCLHLGALVL